MHSAHVCTIIFYSVVKVTCVAGYRTRRPSAPLARGVIRLSATLKIPRGCSVATACSRSTRRQPREVTARYLAHQSRSSPYPAAAINTHSATTKRRKTQLTPRHTQKATQIQALQRGRMARRRRMQHQRAPPSSHHRAATQIQALHRGKRARVKSTRITTRNRKTSHRTKAATRIQAIQRGRTTRMNQRKQVALSLTMEGSVHKKELHPRPTKMNGKPYGKEGKIGHSAPSDPLLGHTQGE